MMHAPLRPAIVEKRLQISYRAALVTLLAVAASAPAAAQKEPALPVVPRLVDTLHMQRLVYTGRTRLVTSMVVVQDGLVLLDAEVTPHVTWIDPRSGAVLSKMGADGTPGLDLAAPRCLRRLPGSPNTISFVDAIPRKLVTVALQRRASRILEINTWDNIGPWCAFRFGDLILVDAAFPDRVYYHVSATTGHIDPHITASPPLPGEIPYNAKWSAVRPDGDRVVAAYESVSRLEVFDTTGRRVKVIEGPVPIIPRIFMAYRQVAATSRFIYAGFCGCDPTHERGDPSVHELHVFTWQGSLVARIPLDRPLHAFAISDDDTMLYASYGPHEKQLVGQWRLPSGLRGSQ